MNNKEKEIDLIEIGKKLFSDRKVIFQFTGIFIIFGFIIAFSIPNRYKVDVIISPESGQTSSSSGNLAGMASILGINSLGISNQDAINSTMFPELIKCTPYILEIYNTKVTPKNSNKTITFSEYIINQKKTWWNTLFKLPNNIINKTKEIFIKNQESPKQVTKINPFKLTSEQSNIISMIKQTLTASIDPKNGMTTISVTLQDPNIAAVIADTAVTKLQQFIIDYRTKKALEDCKYLEALCSERKKDYYIAQQTYAQFMDSNKNVILQRTQAEGIRLQNEMSIAFQIYSQVETQLQVARAKVQESRPVFAILEPSTTPLYPYYPNKVIIITIFALCGIIFRSAFILLFKKK